MNIRKAALLLIVLLACSAPAAAPAGLFGVPTNLDAAGQTTASSVNPPGWFTLFGTGASAADGDATHQVRLFIEVTGTTLDVRVFDPGISGARDYERGGISRTTFQLLRPNGTAIHTIANFNNDTVATQNRLARFTSGGFVALNTGTHFTGLQPGLYEFRATMTNGDDDLNAFGVDVRVSSTDPTHYNVFTIGKTSTPDTAMTIGAANIGTTPYANITQRMVFYPYVTRGCSLQTSNFDMDATAGAGAGAVGDLTDALGGATALTMGGPSTIHVENTVTVHSTAGTNLTCNNYGVYTLTNDTGTQQNPVDWRVADFLGWTDNPANLPRNPTFPVRMYLPNGYFTDNDNPGVPPLDNATPPLLPFMAVSARVVSGANPPAVGQTTRFDLTATVENPGATDLSNVAISIPIVATAVQVGSDECAVDGEVVTCGTDGSGAGYRRRTFASLPAGSVASLSIQVDLTPAAAGLQNLTGVPAATASGTLTPEGITNYLPNNTTVWAQYAPAFSSATYPRTEILGPLCNLLVNVGATVLLPTRASLLGLRVDPTGQVDFATGMQVNSVAFNLYSAPDTGRTSGRSLLNSAPISAPQSTSFTPILYAVQTGPITEPYLYIEEIDRSGRRTLMGPFDIADERLRNRLERVEARLMAAGAAHLRNTLHLPPSQQGRWSAAASPAPHRSARRAAPTKAARIEVSRPGLVRVPIGELAAVGLSPRLAAAPGGLRLTNLGREIPFTLLTGPAGPAAIEFQAKHLSSSYAPRNVYVLSWDRDRPTLAVSLTRHESPKAAGMLRLEANQIYVANAPRGSDPWLWERLAADEPFAAEFDLPGLPGDPGGEVVVQLRLATLTSHRVDAQAWINGVPLRSGSVARPGEMTLRGSLPAAALLPAGNALVVSFSAPDGEAEETAVYLNFLDLGIALPPPTDPMAPDLVVPFDPSLPSLTGTNYLIVTHPLFLDQARVIAAQKAREGFRPLVVDVERAYDRFSAGVVEANAIRALITHWAGRQPEGRYVLLIGDDTFDPRNYFGMGEIPFLPSLTGWDDEFGRIPTENRYADLDDDGSPDLAIGRLPVQTPEQAAILADKIARQGSVLQQNARTHLFALDNQGPLDASFRAAADTVAASLPPASSVVWADMETDGIDSARLTLLQALQQGVLATHYFGHAGPEIWADEQLLTLDDLDSLDHTFRETLLFAWACEAQFFQNIFGPSINEALLLVPGGGALASFGPAGITDPEMQRLLFSRVYRKFLTERLPLGEAIRQAKAAVLEEFPGSRAVVEGWNLLGDPALRLPR